MSDGSGRIRSIDAYRGLAVIAMVIGNFLIPVAWVPEWLKHVPDIGFTIADVIAPMFLFALALNFRASLERRAQAVGLAAALGDKAKRYAALIGIGAVISFGQALILPGQAPKWGVLEALGAAGLLCLPLARLGRIARAVAALLLLAAYQFVLNMFLLDRVLADSHGGLFGSVAWAALLLLSTAVGEGADGRGKWKALLSGLALAGAGTGLHFAGAAMGLGDALAISKNRVSASYVLLTAGICVVLYVLFVWLFDERGLRAPSLEGVGKNPITLYLLHFLLMAFVAIPAAPGWFRQAPPWLTLAQLAVYVGIILGVARLLDRRRIYIVI
jgi:predicted acyltransferase